MTSAILTVAIVSYAAGLGSGLWLGFKLWRVTYITPLQQADYRRHGF